MSLKKKLKHLQIGIYLVFFVIVVLVATILTAGIFIGSFFQKDFNPFYVSINTDFSDFGEVVFLFFYLIILLVLVGIAIYFAKKTLTDGVSHIKEKIIEIKLLRFEKDNSSKIDAYSSTLLKVSSDFNKAFRKYKGTNEQKQQLLDDFNLALDEKMDNEMSAITKTDGSTTTLPENFKNLAGSIRIQIEIISTELMNFKRIEQQHNELKKNIREFLHFEYEVFTNPKWNIINKVRSFLYNYFKAKIESGELDAIRNGETKEEALERLVNNSMSRILSPDLAGHENSSFQRFKKQKKNKLYDIDIIVDYLHQDKNLKNETDWYKVWSDFSSTLIYTKLSRPLRIIIMHRLLIKNNGNKYLEIEQPMINHEYGFFNFYGNRNDWKLSCIEFVEREINKYEIEKSYKTKVLDCFKKWSEY